MITMILVIRVHCNMLSHASPICNDDDFEHDLVNHVSVFTHITFCDYDDGNGDHILRKSKAGLMYIKVISLKMFKHRTENINRPNMNAWWHLNRILLHVPYVICVSLFAVWTWTQSKKPCAYFFQWQPPFFCEWILTSPMSILASRKNFQGTPWNEFCLFKSCRVASRCFLKFVGWINIIHTFAVYKLQNLFESYLL